MSFFVHEKGICESKQIGEGTRIWAFAHILPGAKIGSECNICDGVFIENDVVLGDRVTVKCGVQLWDGVRLEDDTFVGPNATFTNDRFPRSKQYPDSFSKTIIEKGASIGANATVLPGITVGRSAMVGAGAVVTKSVPPYAVVVGNPARIVGYVDAEKHSGGSASVLQPVFPEGQSILKTHVDGVTLHRLKCAHDLRGSLSVGEFTTDVPFQVKRYFIVYDVPTSEVRGQHAHRQCHQFLVCVKGSCSVVVDDGRRRQEVELARPDLGIYLPPMVWGIQYKYSKDAVLLVFASHLYDAKDYIRDYGEFLAEKK